MSQPLKKVTSAHEIDINSTYDYNLLKTYDFSKLPDIHIHLLVFMSFMHYNIKCIKYFMDILLSRPNWQGYNDLKYIINHNKLPKNYCKELIGLYMVGCVIYQKKHVFNKARGLIKKNLDKYLTLNSIMLNRYIHHK